MKGFIELTEEGSSNCKILISVSSLRKIIKPIDSSRKYTYVEIITDSESYFIQESYEKVKQLIINSQ